MDRRKLISYVVPARNEEGYIVDCLKSLYNQKIDNRFEVIVVDNGSSDGTAKKVRELFPDAHLVLETIPGISAARQRGFFESKGDWVVFVDADTRLPEWWTETVLREIEDDPQVVAISGPYKFFDAKSAYIKVAVDILQYLMYWAAVASNVVLKRNTVLIAGDVIIRRDAFERVGGFDTRFVYYREDVDIAKKLSRVGKVIHRWKYWAYSSARRFNKVGLMRQLYEFFKQYLAAVFSQEPADKNYDEYR